MKHVVVLIFLLAGCYQAPTPLVVPPLTFGGDLAVHEIARMLALRGYAITTTDAESGIVSTDWYEYTTQLGGNFVPMPVRERVQVVTDRNATRVTFLVQCDWRKSAAGGSFASVLLAGQRGTDPNYAATAGWEPCAEPKDEPLTAIRERYQGLITDIQAMRKKAATETE